MTDDGNANCSHIGIANSLPTTAYVKMIDVFMIFTMTIPLLEIIGHTYAEHLRLKMAELDEMSDGPKIPLGSPPGGLNFLDIDILSIVKCDIILFFHPGG